MENFNFSITDLVQIKNIIEVASQRGAFRANELTTVGACYDKLKAFLDLTVAKVEETTKQDSPENEQGETNA